MDATTDSQSRRDAGHLDLLATFHFVVAALTALFSCFPFIHLIIGIVMVNGGMQGARGGPPPAFVGWLFIAIAGALILGGWTFALLLALAGNALRLRRRYHFCFVIAAIACLFAPLGTVLGVFTILVLSRDTVKQTFGLPQPA